MELSHLKPSGFFQFIREQGVVGFAIGFILGGAVSKIVSSLVVDVINPAISLLFGSRDGIATLEYHTIMYGKFLANLVDFFIIAFVVYYIFKGLKLDRLDVKKQ
jgi:large conductance mechanosensitive channel